LVTEYHFLTYVAPVTPGTPNPNGQALFNSIGCALCHLPTYTTGARVTVLKTWPNTFLFSKALSSQPVNLYSDLLLHDMGSFLADNIGGNPIVGNASKTQFRTTPLWGLSQRTVYLHDGRATDLTTAIQQHSLNNDGEAAIVIQNFNALSPQDQADLIAFIQSL
jgi:CxxC motif-containing protein (DUF1111 family)